MRSVSPSSLRPDYPKPPPPAPLQNLHVYVSFGKVLRMVFAHYATLDVASTHLCDWTHVETLNRTMSRDEFTKFLMNFDVVPCLLARNDVDGLMEQVMFEVDSRDLTFPEFFELILRCGVLAGDMAEEKFASPSTTISELAALRKLVSFGLPYAKQHYTEMSRLRDAVMKAQQRANHPDIKKQILIEKENERQAALQQRWLQTASMQSGTPTQRKHMHELPWTKSSV